MKSHHYTLLFIVVLVQGRLIFVKQYLKLYQQQEQEQEQDNKNIIIVCKDERDWINPETGKSYSDFNTCLISMITSKNMHIFRDGVIVLDDMGDKLNKDIAYFLQKENIIIFK